MNYNTFIHEKGLELYPVLILLVAILFGATLQQDLMRTINYEESFAQQIEIFLGKQDEDILMVNNNGHFETENGLVRFYRAHTPDDTYLFYFPENDVLEPFIYQVEKADWLTDKPSTPPIVTQSFISFGIGIPSKFVDNEVFIQNKSYTVEYTPYRVNIEDVGVYAPLPTYADRINKFIEEYIDGSVNEIKVHKVHHMKSYELIYFEFEERFYELRVYFNESAEIAEVLAGEELIMK